MYIYKAWTMSLVGLYCILTLSGCSIAMALHGHTEPNFDNIKVGAAREAVEFEFGNPSSTKQLTDGKTQAQYKFELGNSSNPGRASIYGYYDLLTIGLAEPVFTLIELVQGHDEETQIVYGPNNRVLEIHGYTPPAPSLELQAAQEEQEKYVRKRPADKAAAASEMSTGVLR